MSNPNDMDEVGKASGSGRGVWFEYVDKKQSGIHDCKLLRMSYKESQNPKHKKAMMFVAEFEILSSNVHNVGSTRTYVINMAHTPAKDNLKAFLTEVFAGMGYKREDIAKWPKMPGRDMVTVGVPKSAWGDMCGWLLGPDNPAGQKGVILHCESSHTTTGSGGDFTLNRFEYRGGVVTPMKQLVAPESTAPAGATAPSAVPGAGVASGPPIPPSAA